MHCHADGGFQLFLNHRNVCKRFNRFYMGKGGIQRVRPIGIRLQTTGLLFVEPRFLAHRDIPLELPDPLLLPFRKGRQVCSSQREGVFSLPLCLPL